MSVRDLEAQEQAERYESIKVDDETRKRNRSALDSVIGELVEKDYGSPVDRMVRDAPVTK